MKYLDSLINKISDSEITNYILCTFLVVFAGLVYLFFLVSFGVVTLISYTPKAYNRVIYSNLMNKLNQLISRFV